VEITGKKEGADGNDVIKRKNNDKPFLLYFNHSSESNLILKKDHDQPKISLVSPKYYLLQ
jgi:hypothetical protein